MNRKIDDNTDIILSSSDAEDAEKRRGDIAGIFGDDNSHENGSEILTSDHISNGSNGNLESFSEEEFGKRVDFESKYFHEYYGALPEDHESTKYIRGLFKKLNPKCNIEVFVCANWNQVNACAFPNNKIYVSFELIQFCDSEEELLFVLNHEKSHIENNHAKRKFEEAFKYDSVIDRYLALTGLSRISEYQSDAEAFIGMDKEGINSYGGIAFSKKMMESRHKSGWDIEHGSDTDRLVNLFWGYRIYDLENIDEEKLNYITENIKRLDVKNLVCNPKVLTREDMKITDSYFQRTRLDHAKKAGIYSMIGFLKDLYERRKGLVRNLKSFSGTASSYGPENHLKRHDEVLKVLLGKLKTGIDSVEGLDSNQKDLALSGVLELVYGIKLSEEFLEDEEDELNLPDYSFASIEKKGDWDIFLNSLKETLKEKGFYLNCDINIFMSFSRAIFQKLINGGDFFNENDDFNLKDFLEFMDKVFSDLKGLFEEYALERLDQNWIEKSKEQIFMDIMPELEDEQISQLVNDFFIEKIRKEAKLKKISKAIFPDLKESDSHKKGLSDILEERLRDVGIEEEKIKNILGIEEVAKQEGAKKPETDDEGKLLKNFYSESSSLLREFSEEKSLDNFQDLINRVVDLVNDFNEKSEDNFSKDGRLLFEKNIIGIFKIVRKRIFDNENKDKSLMLNNYIHDLLKDKFDSGLTKLLFAVKEKEGYKNFLQILGEISLSREFFSKISLGLSLFDYEYFKNGHPYSREELIFMNSIYKELPSSGFNERFYEKMFDFYSEYSVYFFLSKELEKGKSVNEVLSDLREMQSEIDMRNRQSYDYPIEILDEGNPEGSRGFLLSAKNTKKNFFMQIMQKAEFETKNAGDLRDFYILTIHMDNQSLAGRIQKIIFKKLLESYSFEDAFDFLFKERIGQIFPIGPFQDLTEKKAKNHLQIEQCKKKARQSLVGDEDEIKIAGALANMEYIINKIKKEESLTMLLETREDDKKLKEKLLDISVSARESEEIEDVPKIMTVSQELEKLYRLDTGSKYLILRKLLIGERGVLFSPYKKRNLIDYFFKNFVQEDNEDSEISNTIKEVLDEFAKTKDIEYSYFALFSLLLDRILIKPENPSDWEEIIEKQIKLEKEFMDYFPEEYGELDPEKEDLLSERRDFLREVCYGKIEDNKNEGKNNFDEYIYGLFKGELKESEYEKISSTSLIVEMAKKIGSIGVRFLQLMGQYVDVSDEIKEELKDVYDQVKGQSKLTMHETVKREWGEFEEEIPEIGENIGGGSMATVYETCDRDGQKRVMKVINPSFKYQLSGVYKLLRTVFENLAKSNPAKYEIALSALGDIKEWIELDLNYEGFLEKDKDFHDKWNGITLEGGKYSIKVPKSFGPESKKFKQEEFVEGKNLTSLEELDNEGHETKEIIKLISKNYVNQILDGQVCSDVHIGNFSVTENNEVAILDRNFYLELSDYDKSFFSDLMLNHGNPKGLSQSINNYLASFSENEYLNANPINEELEEILSENQSNEPVDIISSLVIFLRKRGLKMPLKITLLIKNINALDDMAKKVGMSGFIEAIS